MINYLGSEHFTRFFLSSQTRIRLAPRTVSVLQALTNQVTVTLYYDRQDQFYPTLLALLGEYWNVNHKIITRTVDYVRDAGEAEKIKEQYNLAADKNLIVFDMDGRTPQIVPGDLLVQYTYTNVPNEHEVEFIKKPLAFGGETWFTTALLALETPQPLKVCFLQGHGEPSLSDSDARRGYLTFGSILRQNNLVVTNLQLLGEQMVPDDCNLLIIAAPTEALSKPELQKIDQYLAQGGRLFALLDFMSINHPTGLEPILQRWGINVTADYVKDLDNTITGQDIKVQRFNKHPIVNPLMAVDLPLHMVLPRPVSRWGAENSPANAPDVVELAFSSPASTLAGDSSEAPRSYPLIVAAEQKMVAGVLNPRGNTRIVVAGDSFFLGNHYIEDVGNRDFVNSALNWLLDRTALLNGIEPQKVTEYRLLMTPQQQRELRLILVGALPGVVLLLGGLVWLARRK
jgi:ABC-2 type transport system permease protein